MRVERILWFALSLTARRRTANDPGRELPRRWEDVCGVPGGLFACDRRDREADGRGVPRKSGVHGFPAYRKLTGIHLEEKCPTIKYTIYEQGELALSEFEGRSRARRQPFLMEHGCAAF